MILFAYKIIYLQHYGNQGYYCMKYRMFIKNYFRNQTQLKYIYQNNDVKKYSISRTYVSRLEEGIKKTKTLILYKL